LARKQALAIEAATATSGQLLVMKREITPRERILTAAIELFAKHGFEAMTMRRLGDAVGLDNSSLYRHFRNKAALADAVVERVTGEIFAKIAPQIGPTRAITLEALEGICADLGLYFFDQPASARIMTHWIMSMGAGAQAFTVMVEAKDTSRPGGALLAILRSWLDAGVRAGSLRAHAMPEAVVMLLGAMLIRPASRGFLFASLEPDLSPAAARAAWEQELRAFVRGAFAPQTLPGSGGTPEPDKKGPSSKS
jgi:AcrR family transcriptional regulator